MDWFVLNQEINRETPLGSEEAENEMVLNITDNITTGQNIQN